MNNENLVHKNRDYLIKQSEMLQTIIGRMASNSLTIKQLGLTIWTTLMGFGFANKNKSLFLLALLSFAILGFFDAYYLYLEKRFRRNFNRLTELICGLNEDKEELIKHVQGNFLVLEKIKLAQVFNQYLSALLSWANLPYIVVFSATLVILIIN
ncbi:hypothetical protein NIES37_60950 [Tolypothrix tenuis PCC 7101]|uniref:Uncharacterized protein n=1 Tax=Tolypothrix tenuis PCC 7101 TaxID=231146 RepID=A0A1Z4N8P0_9CYAN|nr:hypothetical protein [Aulosira sp. FACHB-113]BAZ02087.1 hypothetical protein NIES37_60950 [Tolypothrix tenuis PCC 7101]BAZ73990.1 hypothetical protein NIES50_25600 [Aulosira laxa NIES-50]